MNAPIRTSPLSDRQLALAARTSCLENMQVVASFAQDDAAKLAVAGIGDLTFRRRAGVKGRGAQAALNDLGIATPDRPNTFLHLDDGTLIARLGMVAVIAIYFFFVLKVSDREYREVINERFGPCAGKES